MAAQIQSQVMMWIAAAPAPPLKAAVAVASTKKQTEGQ
jgi:hypothetical protein